MITDRQMIGALMVLVWMLSTVLVLLITYYRRTPQGIECIGCRRRRVLVRGVALVVLVVAVTASGATSLQAWGFLLIELLAQTARGGGSHSS